MLPDLAPAPQSLMSEPSHSALPQRQRRKRHTKDDEDEGDRVGDASEAPKAEEGPGPVEGTELSQSRPRAREGEKQYEFLDHTADVQVHAWGSDLIEAFENCVLAMFDYMTDRTTIDVDPALTIEVEV